MMTLDEAVAVVGRPTSQWPGNCYYLASILWKHFPGSKLRYGCWTGPIAKGTLFDRGTSWAHHGWLELADGTILDPTRWVFEAKPPYVYHGPNDHYDTAGIRTFAAKLEARPVAGKQDRMYPIDQLDGDAQTVLRNLFQMDIHSEGLNFDQLYWLAHIDPGLLGGGAKPIYQWMRETGNKAFIPLDFWNLVMDETTIS